MVLTPNLTNSIVQCRSTVNFFEIRLKALVALQLSSMRTSALLTPSPVIANFKTIYSKRLAEGWESRGETVDKLKVFSSRHLTTAVVA